MAGESWKSRNNGVIKEKNNRPWHGCLFCIRPYCYTTKKSHFLHTKKANAMLALLIFSESGL